MLTEIFVSVLISSVTANTGFPVFDQTHQDVMIEEGYEATIWCNATGDLPMQYTWYDEVSSDVRLESFENNAQIQPDADAPVSTVNATDGSGLIFNVSELYLSGLYTCSAENMHGLVTKVFNVTVYPAENRTKDDGVIEHVSIDNVTDTSVTFSIRARGNPRFYYVNYTEKVENIEYTYHVRAADSIEIKGLIPSGSYKFQFKVDSTGNVSDLTRVINVVLLPEVPEVIYRNIAAGTVKIEWLRTIDDFSRDTIDGYKLSYRTVTMMRGSYWIYSDCATEIYKPKCAGPNHIIAGLQNRAFYEIQLMAHTEAGYGKPHKFKLFFDV